MQHQFPVQQHEQDGAGKDAIMLLARPVDIGRPRKDDGKVVSLEEGPQAEIRRGARHRIGRRWIEGGVLVMG